MSYDTSIHMNPDANAWAKFFMQTRAENPDLVIDEALMVGWFANAMMAMHDFLKSRRSTRKARWCTDAPR